MGFRQGPAKNREILTIDIDHAAIDRAPARHHAVACGAVRLHAEIGAAVRHEHVKLFERPFIQQQFDPLARGQLAFGMLRLDAARSAALAGNVAACFKFCQNIHKRPRSRFA